jgi:hypothetical protein
MYPAAGTAVYSDDPFEKIAVIPVHLYLTDERGQQMPAAVFKKRICQLVFHMAPPAQPQDIGFRAGKLNHGRVMVHQKTDQFFDRSRVIRQAHHLDIHV